MAKAGMIRRRRSAAQWAALISECDGSGDSRAGFCRRRGIALSTFDHWRRRLREPEGVLRADPDLGFIELTREVEERSAASSSAPGAWDVELDLGGGMRLRLRRTC